ncbi:hypothetical protein ACET3Z_032883 [Daucus carota]
MGEEREINRDVELVDSRGLRHSLLLFWALSCKDEHSELTVDASISRMIGCDEEDERTLLRYRTRFASSAIIVEPICSTEGVIERVFENRRAEMSPDISFYSKDEYPHRDFALTCGIRAFFCFPLCSPGRVGVMEIVSTRNQDVGILESFCTSFKLQKYENPVLGRVLEEVCQTFHLPLTQYWTCKGGFYYSLNQFSGRDFENLAPWCQFKDACLCKGFNRLLGVSNRSAGAFFCSNISALSITKYHLAHYAKNLGSIACFTIYLLVLEEEKEYGREYALEFFLPSQEMDNDYPQTLLNCIWTKVRESLPNCKLAAREREKPGQVLLVKVINSSTHSQPKSFEVGHPQSSLPHNEGSEFTHTLELFEKGPNQISNSKSYEEAALCYFGGFIIDNLVEVSSDDEDVEPVTPESEQLKKSKIPCTVENVNKHFGRPLKDAAKSFGLSQSTVKRICRDVHIECWESGKSQKTDGKSEAKDFSLATSSLPNRCVATDISQDINMMTVKVTYDARTIRFELPSSSGLEELENSVIKRLQLDRKSFSIKYQDDEDDWIDITCDEDVQECMKVSRSLKKPTIKMKLGPAY